MDRLALLRAAARRKAPTPIGALVRGLAAGALGAGAQSLFFLATRKWAPRPSELAPNFGKPEPEAAAESTIETMARRTTDGLMQRGPIDERTKKAAGTLVHYAFGAGWGGLYGLVRESTRVSAVGFGAFVWMASDHLLLPAFRLAAWPNRYSLKEHHYALQAHFVYGLATAGSYALLRDVGPLPLGTIPAMVGLQALAWLQRTPPARLLRKTQPWPRRVFHGTLMQKAALA
jgi:hypothetical protein